MIAGHKPEGGFTIIEALIAFLLLTIGLLGASLFHSTLLSENSDTKARLEATQIAEVQVEKARAAVADLITSANLLTAVSGAIDSSVPTTLNTYTIGVSLANASLDDLVVLELTVDWDGNSGEPLSFSSYISWSKEDFENESGVDLGSATSGYEGNIPIPTGTLTAIPRVELKTTVNGADGIDIEGTDKIRDVGNDLVVYRDGEDAKVAIKLDSNTYVQLATLSEDTNEILSITGRIYGYPFEASKFVSDQFGTVYGVEKDVSCSAGWIEINDYCFEDRIIDLRATAGANCVITDWRNDSTNPATGGLWGDYLCVAGTGWNGGLKPFFREFDQGTAKNLEIGTSSGGKALVCGPSIRNYRYYIVEVTEDNFESLSTDGSVNPTTAISDAAASIAGQAGLVRFTDDANDIETWPERVLWTDYFWHNPDYVVSPASVSADLELATIGSSIAKDGYKSPGVVSGSEYSIQYPGDVARQNFVIADFGTNKDCTDVLEGFVSKIEASGNSNNFDDYGSDWTDHFELAAGTEGAPLFLDHTYYYARGMPGFEGVKSSVEYGYVPSGASPTYVVSDYNDYSGIYKDGGSIILGYALKTSEISGEIYIPDSASYDIEDFILVGDPNPLNSLVCEKSLSATSGAPPGYLKYEYTCGIPTNWKGNIFVYPDLNTVGTRPALGVEADVIACSTANDRVGVTATVPNYPTFAVDSEDFDSEDAWSKSKIQLAFSNFYSAATGLNLSGVQEASEIDFRPLFIHNYESAVSTSQRRVNFAFKEGAGSCPSY